MAASGHPLTPEPCESLPCPGQADLAEIPGGCVPRGSGCQIVSQAVITEAARRHSAATICEPCPDGHVQGISGGKDASMSSGTELTSEQLNLSVDGVSLTVATVRRYSDLAIIFLQGFFRLDERGLSRRRPRAGSRRAPPARAR